MSNPKYPRASVLTHRERLTDDAKSELARTVTEREQRERDKARAEAVETKAASDRAAVHSDENARLMRGELTVSDLARLRAWDTRAETEAKDLAQKVAAAATILDDGRAKERDALASLANRMADVNVLEKDRDRFLTSERTKAEAREEEANAEAYRPRKV